MDNLNPIELVLLEYAMDIRPSNTERTVVPNTQGRPAKRPCAGRPLRVKNASTPY